MPAQLSLSENLKKNKSIVKALARCDTVAANGKLRRGEVVYLRQTPERIELKKSIGFVRDISDADSVYLNIYDDHNDSCPIYELFRIRLVAVTNWTVVPSMRVRDFEYEIYGWDARSGRALAACGRLTMRQWEPLDAKGLPDSAQNRSASIQDVVGP